MTFARLDGTSCASCPMLTAQLRLVASKETRGRQREIHKGLRYRIGGCILPACCGLRDLGASIAS